MQNVGELTLDKGTVRKDVSLFAWDGVSDCDPLRCVVVDKCVYSKTGKCSVQMQYLEALYGAILDTYRYLDKTMLFKIGMQIVPLYISLVKMQMVEMSLESPFYETEKGGIQTHPVYREIRDTLKTIYAMWKDLDLSFTFGGKIDPSKSGMVSGDGVPAVDNERGDPTYYKKISENNISRKGIVR